MSGIYIHIPFCKQACSYCDFHFSTNTSKVDAMIQAIQLELQQRKNEIPEQVETIYFGGGTPSILSTKEIQQIINSVYKHYDVAENPEITLEANPDDLTEDKILSLAKSPVNRLSIGVQSFYEEDLKIMNRAHNANQSKACLSLATQYFENITIDLIYGVPNLSDEKWRANVQTALDFGIPHISAYALTVEAKTALDKWIEQGKVAAPEEEVAESHFAILREMLADNGFVHYEISNFAKEGFFSKNNSAYWLGKKYLGIGPSAHSFDGISRSWNIANNSLYIKGILENNRNFESEILSAENRFNEYVMTGLRTIWGISLEKVTADFGAEIKQHLLESAESYIDQGFLILEGEILKTSESGKFLADGIASALFLSE